MYLLHISGDADDGDFCSQCQSTALHIGGDEFLLTSYTYYKMFIDIWVVLIKMKNLKQNNYIKNITF